MGHRARVLYSFLGLAQTDKQTDSHENRKVTIEPDRCTVCARLVKTNQRREGAFLDRTLGLYFKPLLHEHTIAHFAHVQRSSQCR